MENLPTIYLTKGQIQTLFLLSQESSIGMELRSTVSDQSAVHAVSVLTDGSMGWTTVLAEGDGPNVDSGRRPLWER